ncbi:MAG: hypothetical protein Alpg2KO_33870 [Alphaproteobacteria bacterium]
MSRHDPRQDSLIRCLTDLPSDSRANLREQVAESRSPRLALSPHAPEAAALTVLLQDGLATRLPPPGGPNAMPFPMLCVEIGQQGRTLLLAALDDLDSQG